jgi:RNA-splicing ligase RtcB
MQMEKACLLPVAVAGALMPDAHVGYGLPIGGVLATENTVIPYAVGVDIACRMKLTVLDMPARDLEHHQDRLTRAIEAETRFGIGSSFKHRRQHEVLDADWNVSPVTRQNKDRAWSQLGTSGSGNHFVEFGLFAAYGPGPLVHALDPSDRALKWQRKGWFPLLDTLAGFVEVVFEWVEPNDSSIALEPGELFFSELADGDFQLGAQVVEGA